jgi:hypothetical protein
VQGEQDMNKPTLSPDQSGLLWHIERILDVSEENGLDDAFFSSAQTHLDYLADKLAITPLQAALFSYCIGMYADTHITPDDLAKKIHWKPITVLQYLPEIDVLVKKKLLASHKDRDGLKTFRVTPQVIHALIKNTSIEISDYKNIDIFDFFDALETFVDQMDNEEISSEDFFFETNTLLEENKQLAFVQTIKSYRLKENLQSILLFFCERFVNNDDDEINFHQIKALCDSTSAFHRMRESFRSRDNALFEKGIIENTTSDGFGSRESFKITEKAKRELFSELNIHTKKAQAKKDLVLASSLIKKQLFYNPKEEAQVRKLIDLLKPENYNAVLKRLSEKGMRNGFACLFHGKPGTGKTETVNLIARETGRDIMQVDISKTKSCWFGESEKLIKEVFDKYQVYVEESEIAPLLLFNEADAVIGKRKEVTSGSVAQTENAIQNIILQELETLKGVLIATTNLIQNLDHAFERRFLYKIAFGKPSLSARKAIWQSQIPELSDAAAGTLAARFDFTGGQIENIARKYLVDSVLSGEPISLETLIGYGQDERLEEDPERYIGFTVHG